MGKRRWLVLVCAVAILLAGLPSWAAYGVTVSRLRSEPVPPNPVKTWGRVVSISPLLISDGNCTVEVTGLNGLVEGDYLIVEGSWDGSTLTASQLPKKAVAYMGPARVEMLYIPAGSFLMGNNGSEPFSDPREFPQHSVYLSGYWIGKYELTRGEYRQFMEAGGYSNPAYWSADGWAWKVANNRTEPVCWPATQTWGSGPTFTQTDRHPVVGVSYYEAEAFCNWAGLRLPTEAQWEKAARWTGSYPNVYPWGNTWDAEKCNCYFDSLYPGLQSAPVGSYPSGASPYGCMDMVGNGWEWCRDWYASNYYSQTPPGGWVDPKGPPGGTLRVMRGGNWEDTWGGLCRCAYRGACAPSSYGFDVGCFRAAR